MSRRRALIAAAALVLTGVGAPAGWATWQSGAPTRVDLSIADTLAHAPDLDQHYAQAQALAPRTSPWSAALKGVSAAATTQGLVVTDYQAVTASDVAATWTMTLRPNPAAGATESLVERAGVLADALALAPQPMDVTRARVSHESAVLTVTVYRWPSR